MNIKIMYFIMACMTCDLGAMSKDLNQKDRGITYNNQQNQYDADDSDYEEISDFDHYCHEIEYDGESDDDISDFFKGISITSKKELKLQQNDIRAFSGLALELERQDNNNNNTTFVARPHRMKIPDDLPVSVNNNSMMMSSHNIVSSSSSASSSSSVVNSSSSSLQPLLHQLVAPSIVKPLNNTVVSQRRKIFVQKKIKPYLTCTTTGTQSYISASMMTILSQTGTPTSITNLVSPMNTNNNSNNMASNKRKSMEVVSDEALCVSDDQQKKLKDNDAIAHRKRSLSI